MADKTYCGIKGLIPPPHGIFFNASCRLHDEGYTKGGDSLRRLECDLKFYTAMVEDVARIDKALDKAIKWRRCYYRIWAFLYYVAVRLFGWTRFNYKGEYNGKL